MRYWWNGINALILLGCSIASFFVVALDSDSSAASISDLNGLRVWRIDADPPIQHDPRDILTSIHLTPPHSNVHFRFQLSADDVRRSHTFYRLVGHDIAWQPLSEGVTVLHYMALPAGHYQLEVRSSLSANQQEQKYVVADIVVASVWGRSVPWLALCAGLCVICWAGVYSWKSQKAKNKAQQINREQEEKRIIVDREKAALLLEKLLEECQTSLMLMASATDLQHKETSAGRGFQRLQTLVQQLHDTLPEQRYSNAQIPIILRAWLLPRLDAHCNQAELSHQSLHIVMIPDAVVTLDHELFDQCLGALMANAKARISTEQEFKFLCMLDHAASRLVCRLIDASTCNGRANVHDVLTPTLMSELLFQRLVSAGGYYRHVNDHDGSYGWELAIPASWRLLQGVVPDFSQLSVPIASANAPLVLVIESDPDMSQLLLSWLGERYRLLFSASLQGALVRLQADPIELVLSTARWLPDGDPKELLSQCKTSSETSHIPYVICCVSEHTNDVSASSALADDYLALPLAPTLLTSRVQALLENRQRVKAWLQEHLMFVDANASKMEPPETAVPAVIIDEGGRRFSDTLYYQASRLLEQGGLTVDSLAEQMNLSDRTLQRKIQTLFGMSYTEYVRKIQMQRVLQELDNGSSVKRAAQVAGFQNQSYLTRVFRQTFNMTPTEYLSQRSVPEAKTNVIQ